MRWILLLLSLPAFAQFTPPSGGGSGCGNPNCTVSGTLSVTGATTVGTTAITTGQQIDVVCIADVTAALQAAITSLGNANGGTVRLSSGSCYSTDKITFVNDGATPPNQKSIRITGNGSGPSGISAPPLGGTILDLRYDGTVAKIDTRGGGLLEIDRLTIKDSTASTLSFLQTTNTTLKIHDSAWIGTGTSQDVLILGGTDTGSPGGGPNAPFQGYGTIIRDNYFDHVQRGVYLRTYANAVVMKDNTWWNHCGGTAAIESLGGVGDSDSGGVITGNLIEMNHYTYGIKMARSNGWSIINNNFYDSGVGVSAFIRFEATAVYNLVIDGFHADSVTAISDVSGTNSRITPHQSQVSLFAQPATFLSTVKYQNAGGAPIIQDSAGNQFSGQMFSGTDLNLTYTANGGSSEDVAKWKRASSTDKRLIMQGSGNNVITGLTGDMRIWAPSGEALWLGTSSSQAFFSGRDFHPNGGNIIGRGSTVLVSTTAPTISSGFGSSPSIATNNGPASFTIDVGTGGSASSGVIGLPSAGANGWNCTCNDLTTTSATVFLCKQTATTDTSATVANYSTAGVSAAWSASDILAISCFGR